MPSTPDGHEKWSKPLTGWVSSPGIGPDGAIYVGSGQIDWVNPSLSTGNLYALDPEGNPIWMVEGIEYLLQTCR